jgi:hypothetical protein
LRQFLNEKLTHEAKLAHLGCRYGWDDGCQPSVPPSGCQRVAHHDR